MRTIAAACFGVILFASFCNAQLSVISDWRERNGLAVASSQTISVPAKSLRGFVMLESVDDDPRTALENVNAKKKDAIEALKSVAVLENSIKTTSVRILEWEPERKDSIFGGPNNSGALSVKESSESTAVVYMSFDIPVDGKNSDELTILPYDVCKRLEEKTVFESSKFFFLYVGEVSDPQIKEGLRKAYKEALANANSSAVLSGRTLGKLLALTPEVKGNWSSLEPSYGIRNVEGSEKNPMSQFSPSGNEVFGMDPSKLSRTCSIELRFNIE